MEADMSKEARELLDDPRRKYNIVGAYLVRKAREMRGEDVEIKRRSKHGTLAYVLESLARQANKAAEIAKNVTPETREQTKPELDEAMANIRRQLLFVEHHFKNLDGEA